MVVADPHEFGESQSIVNERSFASETVLTRKGPNRYVGCAAGVMKGPSTKVTLLAAVRRKGTATLLTLSANCNESIETDKIVANGLTVKLLKEAVVPFALNTLRTLPAGTCSVEGTIIWIAPDEFTLRVGKILTVRFTTDPVAGRPRIS